MVLSHPFVLAGSMLGIALLVYASRSAGIQPELADPLLGAAPSLLHGAAITLALGWADRTLGPRRLFAIAAPLLLALETMQAAAVPVAGRGTFDPIDLVAALAGVALGLALIRDSREARI